MAESTDPERIRRIVLSRESGGLRQASYDGLWIGSVIVYDRVRSDDSLPRAFDRLGWLPVVGLEVATGDYLVPTHEVAARLALLGAERDPREDVAWPTTNHDAALVVPAGRANFVPLADAVV